MVWHHSVHMQRAHAHGNFCLIFSPGRRPMRTHKCILFFLQKLWIFWICNQILCGRCASTDFRQVSFRAKTLAPDLEGLCTDFPVVNHMVRKTSFSSFSQCIHVLCASHIFPVKKSKQKIPGATPCSTHKRTPNWKFPRFPVPHAHEGTKWNRQHKHTHTKNKIAKHTTII